MRVKIYFYLFFLFFISSCCVNKNSVNSYKSDNGIVYILPQSVNDLLIKNISNFDNHLTFSIQEYSNYEYQITVDYDDAYTNPWTNNSNRFLLLNGKFYHLYFFTDNYFATVESLKEIEDKLEKENPISYKKKFIINEYAYSVRFSLHGTIINEGHGSVIKN